MKRLGAFEVTTPTPFEIAFRRIYGVSRSLLFDAWTRVEHVQQWWDPRGIVLAACEIDLRIGGRFRFVNQPMGRVAHEFDGTYLEILRPARLVFRTRSPASVGTLSFERIRASETELRMSIECTSTEERDALLRLGFVEGTKRTLQNLEDHVRPNGRANGGCAEPRNETNAEGERSTAAPKADQFPEGPNDRT